MGNLQVLWKGQSTFPFFLVVSGSEEQMRDLGQIARKTLDTNDQDFREAQKELFGEELSAEDWDGMSPEERDENLEEFVMRIKERREERRGEHGT